LDGVPGGNRRLSFVNFYNPTFKLWRKKRILLVIIWDNEVSFLLFF
jgi:hypothetical protein